MKEGGTLRDHLKAAQRAGAKVKDLEVPPVPPGLSFVLDAFQDLSLTRPFEQGQPLPLLRREMEAWMRVKGVPLRPFEVELIEVLDRAWLKAMREGGK